MENINTNNQILVINQETEDMNQEYEVEKIIDMRITPKLNIITQKLEFIKEYLIKWVGYEQLTWEPLENLENCKELLKEFYKEKKRLLKKKEKIKKEKKAKKKKKDKKDKMKKNKSGKKYKQNKSNKNKNKSISSLTNNTSQKNVKKKLFFTQKIIGNINNSIINQNNLIANEDKQDNKDIINNKEKDIIILNESEQKNDKKDLKEDPIKEKEKNIIENNSGDNNNKLQIINGEICDQNYEINNIDYKSMEKMYEMEKFNLLNNNKMTFEHFPKNFGYDFYDKMNFDSNPCDIIDEKEELLKKNRKNENGNEYDDRNNNIIVKEINSLKIPKNISDKFLINITYLNKNDNTMYTKDIESNDKILPKDYLVKYYEYILFGKNKGHKFSKKLSFV